MIEKLKAAELDLPRLLENPEIWQTLDVDYFPPRVERLWTQYDEFHRLFIHIIHPTTSPCLFHKHKWPAAFKILRGKYEMGISYSESEITSEDAYKLPNISKIILTKGSYYEMVNTHALHYVKPLGYSSMSLMLTGPLYPEASFRKEVVDRELKPLDDHRKLQIISKMIEFYN